MDWLAVALPLLSAIVGAVVGGLVVHRLTIMREVAGTRRMIRINHLIEAYRVVMDASNRPGGMSPSQASALETALSDVMLLGDSSEVDAARGFMVEMASKGGAELDPLIKAMRSNLRRELDLEQVPLPQTYNLRINAPTNEPNSRGSRGHSR